jgi:hypothetical protein
MGRARVESVVTIGVAAVVAGIGAAAGFTHTHQAAWNAGQHGWLAWADAVAIECMAVVAGARIARETREGARFPVFPTVVLVVSVIVQMGAQVATAPKTFAGWLFAAIPALACLVIVKFAMRQPALRRPDVAVPDEKPQAEAAPRLEVVQNEDVAEARPPMTWPPR